MAVERRIGVKVSSQVEGQFGRTETFTQHVIARRDDDDLVLVGRNTLEVLRVRLGDIEQVVAHFRAAQILEAQRASGWDCEELGHVFTVGVERCTQCTAAQEG